MFHNCLVKIFPLINEENTTQASKSCVPDWDQVCIRYRNFVEEPKTLGSLLGYVASHSFLDTSLPYYSLLI